MYKNKISAVEVGNEVKSLFCIKLGLGCVLSSIYLDHFDGFCPRKHSTGNGRPHNQIGSKTLLDLDYAEDLGILDENVSKMSDFSEVFKIQGLRIGLKSKSLKLGIGEAKM